MRRISDLFLAVLLCTFMTVASAPAVAQQVFVECPHIFGQVGTPYSSALIAVGGTAPYAYSIVGALPAGLTLEPTTGAITGTPTTAGPVSFTAQVVDANEVTGTSECSITIAPGPPSVSCPAASGQVGVPYASALVAVGGAAPYVYSVIGALPDGLTLEPATGAITGTPTTAGPVGFTAQVVDANQVTATSDCGITIAPPPPSVSCPAASGQVGVPYASALVAAGGTPPYVYSIVGALPDGLTLEPATGAIAGTPTTAGLVSFTAQVVDASEVSATSACGITIAPGGGGELDCSRARAVPDLLWSPNHALVPITIAGVSDPQGGPVTIVVTGVTQDEPVEKEDSSDEGEDSSIRDLDVDGDHKSRDCPDAVIDPLGGLSLRSERLGSGNGRVYVVSFTATDAQGATCHGEVRVCVPHDPSRRVCVDDGQSFSSLGACSPEEASRPSVSGAAAAEPGAPTTGAGGARGIEYVLPEGSDVRIALYDVAGRRVATLFEGFQPKGTHRWSGAAPRLERGVYFCHVRAKGVHRSRAMLILGH